MPQESSSANVNRFLADYINSVAQLELLLLLRTNPQRRWPVDELVRELRVDAAWAEPQLRILVQHRLVEETPAESRGFCYCPATAELEHAVTAVAQAYLLNRVSVIEFIYSKPDHNIRAFADAFRLRKEPPGG